MRLITLRKLVAEMDRAFADMAKEALLPLMTRGTDGVRLGHDVICRFYISSNSFSASQRGSNPKPGVSGSVTQP